MKHIKLSKREVVKPISVEDFSEPGHFLDIRSEYDNGPVAYLFVKPEILFGVDDEQLKKGTLLFSDILYGPEGDTIETQTIFENNKQNGVLHFRFSSDQHPDAYMGSDFVYQLVEEEYDVSSKELYLAIIGSVNEVLIHHNITKFTRIEILCPIREK